MYIRIITVYIYGNRQNLRSAADDIRDASKAMSRSVNAQAEYWIRLGMMSELYPELNHQQIKLLMLKSGSDRLLEVINAINNH